MQHIVNNIFSVTADTFSQLALDIFHFQYSNNLVYRQWVDALHIDTAGVADIKDIPFLPIQFFKTHSVVAGRFDAEVVFESSGTTGQINSRHLVKFGDIYRQGFMKGFNFFYGDIRAYCIIGLLPSYLERHGSSLVLMVDELIKASGHPHSGFYLYDHQKLFDVLNELEQNGQKTLLIGVTFALLDFAEKFPARLKNTIVMETGGMKGRRKEMTREEVHYTLKQAFGVDHIHSEYGMTELLSQAYSKGEGQFKPVPWMKVLLRDDEDPLQIVDDKRGLINIIDLANVYSCSFIATDDAGTINDDGTFEVIGRRDNSDIRGCSLMVI